MKSHIGEHQVVELIWRAINDKDDWGSIRDVRDLASEIMEVVVPRSELREERDGLRFDAEGRPFRVRRYVTDWKRVNE